ncbi:MAG: hypothetical protein F4Y47_05480 [Acidobacteriia bacterium]|nr:hypothetical protein [Terriglobia bacterium]MYG04898.1 hypothetical protein [Terriglobia bacterium]MYK09024.1 hypothetical protein [Terriglobia bacterium]
MVCLLAPISAWSEEETLPSAADGQEVIVGRIAGLPLSHGLDGVYPDYRECVRVDSFVSQGGERLDVLEATHYVMRFRVTVTYLADCQWQLSYFEHHDRRAFVRAVEETAAAAAAQSEIGGVSETADFGFRTGKSGRQEELDGEIVFTRSETSWGVAGIRDSAFGWQERETENSDQ